MNICEIFDVSAESPLLPANFTDFAQLALQVPFARNQIPLQAGMKEGEGFEGAYLFSRFFGWIGFRAGQLLLFAQFLLEQLADLRVRGSQDLLLHIGFKSCN